MNDQDLNQLFDELDSSPNPTRKQQILDQALETFTQSQTNDQGSEQGSRLKEDNTVDFPQQTRSQNMEQTKRWLYSGMASAAVLVLAVGVVTTQWPGGELSDGVDDLASYSDPWATPELASEQVLEEVVVTASNLKTSPSIAREFKTSQQSRMVAEKAVAVGSLHEPAVLENRFSFSNDETMGDRFDAVTSNPVNLVSEEAVSTFSIDVDTAAYSYVRRQLLQGRLPQQAAVRLEEMVNYFDYDYSGPASTDVPFKANISVLPSPWNEQNQLVHIGIKGYELPVDRNVRSNLVFLLDVSGSMSSEDKLPLVKQSLGLMLSQLHPEDTVAIVVYAGAAGTVLEPTPVTDKSKILNSMDRLQAGGSTAGGAGIELAYQLAESSFIEGGINRILLATDGDFNVGIRDPEALKAYVERKRESGVYLSVLGFGQGNYHDALMQQLAQNGNGIASYIDSFSEARKVLVDEARSQLFAIANDVKIQVEFNPATVSEYRLLGYETRALRREDFNNDKVDAGEIGSGHTVTAIYEITPRGNQGLVDESRYSESVATQAHNGEYGFLKLRYKLPGEAQSKLVSEPILATNSGYSNDVGFSVAVAGFAQLLTGGQYTGSWDYDAALQLAQKHRGEDEFGYRAEFSQLVRAAMLVEQ